MTERYSSVAQVEVEAALGKVLLQGSRALGVVEGGRAGLLTVRDVAAGSACVPRPCTAWWAGARSRTGVS